MAMPEQQDNIGQSDPNLWKIFDLKSLENMKETGNSYLIEKSIKARTCRLCKHKIEKKKYHFAFNYKDGKHFWIRKFNICPACLENIITVIKRKNLEAFATGGWGGNMR
jgi:hypothetical protein